MYKTQTFLVGLLIFFCLTPCVAADSLSCDDNSNHGIRRELLADRRTADLYRASLSGDKTAPLKLASEIAKSRPGFVICINRLGAENGDSVSQYNYATRLFETTDEAAQLRGMYWLKKAAAANLEVAKSLLASKQRSK